MAQVLDFCLRCNSLNCRAALTERAVVTTCSHIFCFRCAEDLNLSRPTNAERHCPACQTSLVNPDDAVSTVLNPTEDYKTSVLSGLDPNTIVECAGRALSFWTYQTTQEIFYQDYLGKHVTEKYGALNKQMDKVIHDANSEISSLQQKISELQANQEQLHKKNQELVEIYREKSRKHAQITNLYNVLKTRAMRSHIQTAVSDSVSHTLDSLGTGGHGVTSELNAHRLSTAVAATPRSGQREQLVGCADVEQLHRHQRSSSGHNRQDNTAMFPPSAVPMAFRNLNPEASTPQHRTRLPQPSTTRSVISGVMEFRQQGSHQASGPPVQFPDGQYGGQGRAEYPINKVSPANTHNYGFSGAAKIGRPAGP